MGCIQTLLARSPVVGRHPPGPSFFRQPADWISRRWASLRGHEEPELEPESVTQFDVLGLLGEGGFGRVFLCVHLRDGHTYALKQIKLEETRSVRKRAMKEVVAYKKVGSHPNILRLYSSWVELGFLFMRMEYVSGGDLTKLIRVKQGPNNFFTEAELRTILLQVCEGLRHMHSMELVHNDIKPDNILVERGADDGHNVYKIGDLGLVTSTANTKNVGGDLRYLSREVLRNNAQGTKGDIFALGLTIYEAAGGGPLPRSGAQWYAIRCGQVRHLERCSFTLNQLIRQMIQGEPAMRPHAREILVNFGGHWKN